MLKQIIESPVKDRDDKYIYIGENLIPENARHFESPPWVKSGGSEVDVTPAPIEVFDEGYSRNLAIGSINNEMTSNGITISYNDDGSFVLNGTCTSSGTTLGFRNLPDLDMVEH